MTPLPRLRLVRDPAPTPRIDRRTPTLPLPRIPESPVDRTRRVLPADVERTAERLDLALSGRLRAPHLLAALTPASLADLRAAHAAAVAAGDRPCPRNGPPCGPVDRCPTHDAALRAWWDVLHPAARVLTPSPTPDPSRPAPWTP